MAQLLDLNFDVEEFFARNEDKNCRETVAKIRDWIENGCTVLEVPKNLTDAQIVVFLAYCGFDVVATQKRIQKYYALRKSAAYLFSNRNVFVEDIESQKKIFRAAVSPSMTEDGCRVVSITLIESLPEQYLMEPALRLGFMILDYLINCGPSSGLIVIYDIKNVQIGHLAQVRLGAMRYFFQYVQDCIPVKFVSIHFINTVSFIDKVMSIVKPFLRGELLKALHFHSTGMDLEKFHCIVSKKHLAKEYGGLLGSLDDLNAEVVEKLEKMHDFFEVEEAQRAQFGRKIKVKETQDTFKHLDID